MIELEFLGLSGDGTAVVFTDATGERYNAALNDRLRAATRQSPTLSAVPTTAATPAALRPSTIQSLLREGISAAEIAESHGVNIESVARFESPVLAEKAWAVTQAQRSVVGAETGAPTLEELVLNRLAARGVEPGSIAWSALRRPDSPWEVSISFAQSGSAQSATWHLRGGDRVEAVDQEASWLTETAVPFSPLSALLDTGDPAATGALPPADSEQINAAEALVAEANARRGRRQPLLDDVTEPSESALADDPQERPAGGFFAGRVLPFEPPFARRRESRGSAGQGAGQDASSPSAATGEAPSGSGPATADGEQPARRADASANAHVSPRGRNAPREAEQSPADSQPAGNGGRGPKSPGSGEPNLKASGSQSSGSERQNGNSGDARKADGLDVSSSDRVEPGAASPKSASPGTDGNTVALPAPAGSATAPDALFPASGDTAAEPRPDRTRAGKRRAVPSWDEIVFGVRHN